MQKAQALEAELESTRARLKQAEKVLAKKEQEWIPIGKFAEMSQRCEKAETLCRGLREETQRQRTALRFAKQERESKEGDLRCANTEGFHLHQQVSYPIPLLILLLIPLLILLPFIQVSPRTETDIETGWMDGCYSFNQTRVILCR